MRLIKYAKDLRRTQTEAERNLWYHLRAHRYKGLKFKRQKPLGNYIVNFICMHLQLIIEIDGSQHAEQLIYDTKRTAWLEQEGFHVLRFWNHEVLTQMETVLTAIDAKVEILKMARPLP